MNAQKHVEVRRFMSCLNNNFEDMIYFRPITLRPVELASLLDTLQGIYEKEAREIDRNMVVIGANVNILNMEDHSEYSFTLSLPQHSDPASGSISVLSPLGSSLTGKKKGDIVKLYLGNSCSRFCIVSVTHNP